MSLATDWHRDQLAMARQDREDREARERAWIEDMSRKLRAKRHRAEAAAAVRATSGNGWRVLQGPTPHAAIEGFVQRVYDLAWHAVPWPAGWRVRWGQIDCGKPGTRTLAACSHHAKLIIVDRRWLGGRSESDFLTTIVHELVHMVHGPGAGHGQAFRATLDRALAWLKSLEDQPVQPNPPTLAASASKWIKPILGKRPTRGGGWVSQPWLEATLEYRG